MSLKGFWSQSSIMLDIECISWNSGEYYLKLHLQSYSSIHAVHFWNLAEFSRRIRSEPLLHSLVLRSFLLVQRVRKHFTKKFIVQYKSNFAMRLNNIMKQTPHYGAFGNSIQCFDWHRQARAKWTCQIFEVFWLSNQWTVRRSITWITLVKIII